MGHTMVIRSDLFGSLMPLIDAIVKSTLQLSEDNISMPGGPRFFSGVEVRSSIEKTLRELARGPIELR